MYQAAPVYSLVQVGTKYLLFQRSYRFQIGYLCGEDVYAWFDRPLVRYEYRPLTRGGVPQTFMPHQADMSDAGLTYHYQIFGAEMGTGKTLAAQMAIEKSGVRLVWWAGPKTSIPNIKREP